MQQASGYSGSKEGISLTLILKRFKCLDIAVYNILSLLKSGMHLKCVKISVKNNEPPQAKGKDIIMRLRIIE
jgi:hypothetical protein